MMETAKFELASFGGSFRIQAIIIAYHGSFSEYTTRKYASVKKQTNSQCQLLQF